MHFKLEAKFYLTTDRNKVKNTNPGTSQTMKQLREERNKEMKELTEQSALPAAEALQKELQGNKADTAALLHTKAALQFHHSSALQTSSSQLIYLHLS